MFRKFFNLAIACSAVLLFITCDKPNNDPVDPDNEPNNLGWYGDENMTQIPTNVTYFGGGGSLPASVDLVPKFPPIGDQGQYGTCVAWAVGYNHKTAINGMDKGYSGSQLSSAAYQFSPKDLFTAIPDQDKGTDCNGTNFATALDVVQNRGIATMQTVPYNNLGDCGQSSGQSNWANEASQHRIKYWRKVQAETAADVKTLLADNIPIIFGARLADNFMTWNSEAVISSNTSFDNVGQHAYHAMVIAGYDDNKGAFKVINSWGTNWGSSGYIWVDYDFFMNEFCRDGNGERPLFMAVNEGGNITPPDDPDPTVAGVDLAAWVFDDYADGLYQGYPKRVSEFNVYNIGSQTAQASKRWSIYYLAFNAYDANDYGVLFNCEVNTDVAYGTEYCANFNSCTYNVNIPSGSDFAYEHGLSEFGFAYAMPLITGFYYLVAYVDPFDAFAETDETNNYFYPYFDPIYFVNGVGFAGEGEELEDRSNSGRPLVFKNTLSPDPDNLRRNNHHSLTTQHPNAYRSEEIAAVIRASKKDGRWEKKLAEMRARNAKQ
ncbi:MAG: C1 family peptidase [Saprospiraceae bacterium]|jgi:hypothetical protein|nr:C1 family peptidase [Saprospiraceae bacterium]